MSRIMPLISARSFVFGSSTTSSSAALHLRSASKAFNNSQVNRPKNENSKSNAGSKRLFFRKMTNVVNPGDSGENKLSNILKERFPNAKNIYVEDISGGCGSMFEVHIETEDFKGLRTVAQHKLVTNALKEEVTKMHGLRSMESNILDLSLDLLEKTFSATQFTDSEDATAALAILKDHLKLIVSEDDAEVKAQWKKFCNLGMTVFSCSSFNDMVKIIWRMAKEKRGETKHMFCVFIVGISAILFTLRGKSKEGVDEWEKTCVSWLGNQITIGGKGVTGKGEGFAMDRIQQFFMTPYLHDFD